MSGVNPSEQPEGTVPPQDAAPAPVPQPGYAPQADYAPQAPYGAAQSAYQPAPGGSGQPPAKTGFPAWAWWVIGGGVALFALIVVAVVLLLALGGNGGPKGVAEDYVNSLNAGDVGRANELARVVDTDKRQAVLVSDAFAEADQATDFTIDRLSQRDDLAMAEVSYLIDGSKLKDYVEISKDGDGWYVSKGLTYRLPSVHASGVEGYRIPGFAQVIDGGLDLEAYPGVYTMLPPNDLFELASDTTFELGSDFTTVDPEFVPSQAYFDVVNDALKSRIDACLEEFDGKDVYALRDCGLGDYPTEVYSANKVSVKLSEYPTVGIDEYGMVGIVDRGAATVTVSGTKIGGSSGSERLETDMGSIIFNTTVKNGAVNVEFY